MRIAMFTDSFFPELGGIQDSILATTRALGQRGHEVRIYAPAAGRNDYAIANLPFEEVDLGGNVTICRLLSLPVPSPTRQSRLVVPSGRRWRDVAGFRPNIIHTHTFFGAGCEALYAARRLHTPIVGTNHWAVGEFNAYVPLPAKAFARASVKLVTWYYDHCTAVTGPSRSVLQEMRACGLTAPHAVISNPIDTATFRPATPDERVLLKSKLNFSAATIVYAGRLAIEKNIDVLIRALALLERDIPEVMLVLAGHGTAQGRLKLLSHDLGVAHRVKFLGTLGKPLLADVFRAADVFAIASTSETQSMTLLQAMSSGLPSVGARWRALPEYINEDCGFVVAPFDCRALADRIVHLLTNQDARSMFGRNAAAFAQQFSTQAVVDRWEILYRTAIQQKANNNGRSYQVEFRRTGP